MTTSPSTVTRPDSKSTLLMGMGACFTALPNSTLPPALPPEDGCDAVGTDLGAGKSELSLTAFSAKTFLSLVHSSLSSAGLGMEENHAFTVMVFSAAVIRTSVTYAFSSPPANAFMGTQSGKMVRNGVCSLIIYPRRCLLNQ